MNEKNASIFQEVLADMPAAFADAGHPGFHLTAPAHFTIDFWGAIKHNDYYHIMYHVCPKPGDFQEDTVFFHSRSQNLIDWELLPPPILPTDEELRLNDGCICLDGSGNPVMLYTRVPKAHPLLRTHHAAYGDENLIEFTRICGDPPFLTLEKHGSPAFQGGWSDPYVFSAEGRTFMVMSKCVTPEGKNLLPIYEAADDSMLHWDYRGILFDNNGEVVNFFPIGDKWVLIYSPYDTIEYFVGHFDISSLRFTPATHGILSYGYHSQDNPVDRGFYATCLYTEEARTVLCGWISGFKSWDLWNGCMGIPRTVGLNPSFQLTQQPIVELENLHDTCICSFAGERRTEINFSAPSDMLDILLEYQYDLQGEIGLTISEQLSLCIAPDGFTINGEHYSCDMQSCGSRLRLLVDRTVAELFFGDGSVCATRCFDHIGSTPQIQIVASGEAVLTDLHCHTMNCCNLKF